jgi:hypothetical protein
MRSGYSGVGLFLPVAVAAAFSSLPSAVGAQGAARPGLETAYFEAAVKGVVAGTYPRLLVGGEPTADVQDGQMGEGDVEPGPVRYTEILAEVPAGDLPALIRGWLDGSQLHLDGRVVLLGPDLRPQLQRDFSQALITEVAFPALDAGRTGPIFPRLKLLPLQSELASPMPATKASGHRAPESVQFSVQLDGLDQRWVRGVEPFSIGLRSGQKGQGTPRLAASRLTLTVSANGAAELDQWHRSFVLQGNHAPNAERSLALRILTANGSPALVLNGQGVGILSLRRGVASSTREPGSSPREHMAGALYQADLYVERWQLAP